MENYNTFVRRISMEIYDLLLGLAKRLFWMPWKPGNFRFGNTDVQKLKLKKMQERWFGRRKGNTQIYLVLLIGSEILLTSKALYISGWCKISPINSTTLTPLIKIGGSCVVPSRWHGIRGSYSYCPTLGVWDVGGIYYLDWTPPSCPLEDGKNHQ